MGRVAGGPEPIPAVIGREAGYTLDRSPVHRRALYKYKTVILGRVLLYVAFMFCCTGFLSSNTQTEPMHRPRSVLMGSVVVHISNIQQEAILNCRCVIFKLFLKQLIFLNSLKSLQRLICHVLMGPSERTWSYCNVALLSG